MWDSCGICMLHKSVSHFIVHFIVQVFICNATQLSQKVSRETSSDAALLDLHVACRIS